MNTMRTCEQCRQPLPENAPEGLCPACLAKVALGTEPAASGATINISPLAEAAPGTRVPPKPADLAPQFPQLEILELLGMGGMGMVYKARQPKLDRFVALKILPLESAQHPYFAERFNREAKALAKLNHPGIVDVYDFGQTSQYYYFVMEYVDGMNLRQLLKTQTLEPRQALELVTQICTALQFAHDEGVVHRDIKPENILLNKKGQVKIADFGLAKLLGAAPDTALTMSQAAMGTFNYMAPEQRENAQKVDHRADIYSLGVVFYEMLTGEVPMGRFEAPSKRVQVDVRLDEVVLKALEREPARRYQHVSEVKSNVETITSTTPAAPATPPAAQTSSIRPPTFVGLVIQPMLGFLVFWLVLWIFARDWSYLVGFALLCFGLPGALFGWHLQAAGQGLEWRQLPPTVRLRGTKRLKRIAAACVAALVCGIVLFPSRTTEWREEWFTPKSQAYEKCVLSGNITAYQIPFWSRHSVLGSGTMALRIYRQDSPPAGLTFSLPGLVVQTDAHDPGQPTRALTMNVLTNWMLDSARLNLAEPRVQAEARQLMDLFEPYSATAPASWQELADKATAKMPDFIFGGFSGARLAEMGAFRGLFYMLTAFPGALACLYYFLAFRTLKRAFAEGRAEIEAGRWTPPPVAQPMVQGLRTLAKQKWYQMGKRGWLGVLLCSNGFFGSLVAGYEAGTAEHQNSWLSWLFDLGFLALACGFVVWGRAAWRRKKLSAREIRLARERGLWPPLGEQPSFEHVRRMVQAGEAIMAIRVYRELQPASFAEAKAAVELLATRKAEPSLVTTPPPVAAKPDLFWRRLVLVILGLVGIPIVLSLLAIPVAMLLPALARAKLSAHHIAAQRGNQAGWQLMNEGKLEDARKRFTQVVAEFDPASVDGWNGLGWTWLRAGQTQAAETNFQKALSFDTNCPGALNGLGQIYLLQKNYDLAEKDLLQAAPKESGAWNGLARIYLLEGKFDRAIEWAQKLVDSGSADDTARQMLQAAREKHVSDEMRQALEAPPNSDKTSVKPMPEKLSP